MGPAAHFGLAVATGTVVGALGGGWEGGVVALAAGTLIDADHLVDYFAAEGFVINLGIMLSGSYFRKTGRAYVILHSYELVVLSFIALVATGHVAAAAGLMAGATTHLVSDLRCYRLTPLAYSLAYRLSHRFRLTSMKPRPSSKGYANLL